MITFKNIRWKNLLSTGNNFTEINLDASNTTLIIGDNGAGKSTILDALCFALFGKPFRRINKPSLINSVNGKNLVVELEFKVNGKEYKIVRGIKPNRFEIWQDDIMINQNSTVKDYQEQLEKFIIKMNYKSFTSIIILGSASFTPFMQLSAADRRLVIEDLLDIQVFSTMNVLVRQRMQENKEQARSSKIVQTMTQEKLGLIENNSKDSTENLLEMEMLVEKKKTAVLNEHGDLSGQLAGVNTEHAKFEMHFDQTSMEKFKKKHSKLLNVRGQVENNKNRIEKEISFYEINDHCPSCHQTIEKDFKEEIVTNKLTIVDECLDGLDNIDMELKDIVGRINFEQNKQVKYVTLTNTVKQLKNNIDRVGIDYDNLCQELRNIKDKIEKSSTKNTTLIESTKKELKDIHNKLLELSDEHAILEITMRLLKDGGIKSKIIKQYLPVINKKVNQYLSAMEFFVNFELDENFNESLKARHLDAFSYANFSEGEKMRIDLALLFTWRAVAKMRNSVHTNLLILDEIFDSSLDSAGTEEFLKIMLTLIGDTNVFVISHKTDQLIEKFDKTIHFEKYKNFSRIKND